jgi:hypothetical protein
MLICRPRESCWVGAGHPPTHPQGAGNNGQEYPSIVLELRCQQMNAGQEKAKYAVQWLRPMLIFFYLLIPAPQPL